MHARATLATEQVLDRHGHVASRVCVLRSHAPLVLRPTLPKGIEPGVDQAADVARVALASGAAGPLGGDEFALDVRVGAGSTLVLNEISATLLLPGARGGCSHMRITVHVEADATLVWMPEPVIAARGCDHVHDIRVELAPSARFLMRDELLLGRHREPPGDLLQNLRVRRGGRALFHQQLRLGPSARGWRSPAVLGANKCVGTVLAVDPAWANDVPGVNLFARDAALLPLQGPAAMVSALAADSLALRRTLHRGIALLGARWAPAAASAGAACDAAVTGVDSSLVTVS
ncbi:MAG TPA: urease accessory protein UreD [Oleiagrimonas sp.]|nr:urease accessory protein UreD [Oleiagrimonas sp.]